MKPLRAKLDAIKASFEKKAPAEALEVMHRVTRELEESGQASRAVGAGAEAPDFALPDTDGRVVRLSELVADGPAVVTFFRGHW